MAELVGLIAAAYPAGWMTFFSADPAVIAYGSQYLRVVGPFYGFFGVGMVLYFCVAGRGAARVAAGRRVVASCRGGRGRVARACELTHELTAVFSALGLALAVFGALVAGAVALGAWGAPRVAAPVTREPIEDRNFGYSGGVVPKVNVS